MIWVDEEVKKKWGRQIKQGLPIKIIKAGKWDIGTEGERVTVNSQITMFQQWENDAMTKWGSWSGGWQVEEDDEPWRTVHELTEECLDRDFLPDIKDVGVSSGQS